MREMENDIYCTIEQTSDGTHKVTIAKTGHTKIFDSASDAFDYALDYVEDEGDAGDAAVSEEESDDDEPADFFEMLRESLRQALNRER